MSWESLDVSISAGDDCVTSLLTPKKIQDNPVFQLDNVAIVKATQNVENNPSVLGIANEEHLCIAIDSNLLLFDATAGLLHKTTIKFETLVDALAWSIDGSCLIIGDRQVEIAIIEHATIYGLDLFNQMLRYNNELKYSAKEIHLFQKIIDVNVDKHEKIFCSIAVIPDRSNEDHCQILLLMSSGLLMRITHLNLRELLKAIDGGNIPMLSQIKDNIRVLSHDISQYIDEPVCMTYQPTFELSYLLVIGGKGNEPLCVLEIPSEDTYNVVHSISSEFLGTSICKCCLVDRNLLLVLHSDKSLSLWACSLLTLFMMKLWQEHKVENFLCGTDSLKIHNSVFSYRQKQPNSQKLFILSNENENYFIHVLSMPFLHKIYSVSASTSTYLIEMNGNKDNVFFIESRSFSDDNSLPAMRVKSIRESSPSQRFSYLLHKGRYQEALDFAHLYQFGDEEIQLVYMVKADWLLGKAIASEANSNLSPDTPGNLFNTLTETLDNIKSNADIVRICSNSGLSNVDHVHKLLVYARNRLDKQNAVPDKFTNEETQELKGQVETHLLRLGTFLIVSESSFRSFSSVQIVWQRHLHELELTSYDIDCILSSIPIDACISSYASLLRDCIVPFVFKQSQNIQSKLCGWVIRIVKDMEERDGWPMNALELVNLVSEAGQSLLTTSLLRKSPFDYTNMLSFGIQRTNIDEDQVNGTNNFGEIRELVTYLAELEKLYKTYNCKLKLEELKKATPRSIIFNLLENIKAAELIPSVVNSSIRKYMTDYGVSDDKVFSEYIKEWLDKISYNSLPGALWETRAVAVVNVIRNNQYVIEATMEIMRHAGLPWSDNVKALVENSMTIDHPKKLEIENEYRLIEVKEICQKYGIDNFNISDINQAERTLLRICHADTSFQMKLLDAKKIIRIYSSLSEHFVFVTILQDLSRNNRSSESIELLKVLPSEDLPSVIREFFQWIAIVLNDEPHPDLNDTEERKAILETTLVVLKYLLSFDCSLNHEELKEMEDTFRAVLKIQTKFGIDLSLIHYENPDYREIIFNNLFIKSTDHFIEGSLRKDVRKSKIKNPFHNGVANTFTDLSRYASLFDLSRNQYYCKLANFKMNNQDCLTSLNLVRNALSSNDYSTTKSILFNLYHICKCICEQSNVTWMDELHSTLQTLLAKCDSYLVCDCLELCKISRLLCIILQQCEDNESVSSLEDPSSDHDSKRQLFMPFFTDDGLVLKSSIVAPMLARYMISVIPTIEESGCKNYYQDRIQGKFQNGLDPLTETFHFDSITKMCTASKNLIDYLRENNLVALAFQVTNQTIEACAQHLTLNSHIQNMEVKGSLSELLDQYINEEFSPKLLDFAFFLTRKICYRCSDDIELAFSYATSLPANIACNKLKELCDSVERSYRKLRVVSVLGILFTNFYSCPTDTKLVFKRFYLEAKWCRLLSELKIPAKGISKKDILEKEALLTKLVENSTDLTTILQYCRDFQLDVEPALLSYLQIVLSPNFATKERMTGGQRRVYESQIKLIISEIDSSESAANTLIEVFKKLNFYDYEHATFILALLTRFCSQTEAVDIGRAQRLLDYLIEYKRTFEPSQYELSFTLDTDSRQVQESDNITSLVLDPLARQRLPLHPLLYGDQWKIISPELHYSTIGKLIPIGKLLNMSTDQMLANAIQNTISKASDSLLTLDSDNHYFAEQIEELLQQIESNEVLIATAYNVIKQLPLVPLKIKLMKFCVKITEIWKASTKDKVEKRKAQLSNTKLMEKWCYESTRYQLCIAKLDIEPYNSLVNKPSQLIRELYNHQCISLLTKDRETKVPDIHGITSAIAQINGIDIIKMRMQLIERWLAVPDESTFYTEDETDYNNSKDEPLAKLTFMLKNFDEKIAIEYLFSFATSEKSTKTTFEQRKRALQVLLTIASADKIAETTGKSIKDIRHTDFMLQSVSF
ncbi:Kinetochore-associated protein 1 [Trichoplax sp. H2]|nr:Kinetochore-associated protein 1 [Trichoplax sp. H2]|eukprot:RDD47375.1 Kinetochore-associated protein 1 [Trichoplax sp. H2]